MELPQIILLINCFATLYMVGVIWMVQIVAYPLFASVGENESPAYQKRHQILTTLVVGPPMVFEAFSSVFLAWYPPPGIGYPIIFAGIILVFIIWISTAALQIPSHEKLLHGFTPKVHNDLVFTNWIRTLSWSARGFLVVWMLALLLSSHQ
jgi:hypothetical protein